MLWDMKAGFSCELKAGPVTRSSLGRTEPALLWQEHCRACARCSFVASEGMGESVVLKAQFEAGSLPMAVAVAGR